jgi:hypothetical protein
MLRFKDLAAEAARLYLVSPEQVIGESRSTYNDPTRARDAAIYVAKMFGFSYRQLGRLVGTYSHCAIYRAAVRAKARIPEDPEFDYRVGRLVEWANSRVSESDRQPNPHRKDRPHRPVKRVAKVKEGRVTRVVALPAAPSVDEIIADRMKSMERWLTEA